MLIRQTASYLPAQVLAPLSQFVALVAWTHLADSKTIGVVTLVAATQELLSGVCLAFWSQYVLRYYSEICLTGDGNRLESTSRLVVIGSASLQVTVGLVALHWAIDPGAGWELAAAVSLYVATRAVTFYFSERARADVRVGEYSFQTLAGPVGGLAIGLAFLYFFGPDPVWPLLGYAIAQSVAVGYGVLCGRKWADMSAPDWTLLRSALAYGGPLVAYGALGWISLNSGRFLVDHLLGTEAAGAYSVGFGLGFRAAALPAMAVTAAGFPLAVGRMNAGDRRGAFDQLARNGALLAGVVLPSVIGLYLVSGGLVRLLIAPAFWQTTVSILPWSLVAGAVLNFRSHFVQQAFLLDGRTYVVAMLSACEAILSTAGAYVLIETYGVAGGATALALSSTTVIAAAYVFASRRGLWLPLVDFAKLAIAAGVMSVVVLAVPDHSNATSLVVRVAAGSGAYLTALLILYAMAARRLLTRVRR